MSDFDPAQVIRIPGQLYLGVTNLAVAGYGGTKVGYFENGQAVVSQESEDILSEAIGKRVGKLVAETLVGFSFDLIQYDLSVLAKVWSLSGTTLREGGTGLLTAQAPCLFAPDDPAHPGILLFAPVFRHGGKTIAHGSMGEKRRERIIVDAIVDGSGQIYACDTVHNLIPFFLPPS